MDFFGKIDFLGKIREWIGPSKPNIVTHAYDDDIGLDDGAFEWFGLYGTDDYGFGDKEFPMAKAYALCRSNVLAKRLLNFVCDIVVSTGIKVTSDDKELSKVFQRFQENPENAWQKLVKNLSNFKMIFGETALEPIINPANGVVTINPLAPTHIRKVKRDKKNNNFDKSFEYHLSPTKHKTYNVLRPYLKEKIGDLPENPAFFWKHNVVFNESRGVPDLFPIFDILKAHKDIHMELKNQVARYNWILLLVEMAGWEDLDDGEQKEKMENIAETIRKGGVVGFGKGDSYEWITPNFQDFDIKTIELAYLKYAIMDFGFPLHYFATPDDSNRATAQEMDYPTEVSMLSHQEDILEIVRQIFHLVKWAWLTSDHAMGKEDNDNMTILIEAPSVSSRLALRQAEGLQRFSEALETDFPEFDYKDIAELKAQILKAAGFYFDKAKVLANVKKPPEPPNVQPMSKKSKRSDIKVVAK